MDLVASLVAILGQDLISKVVIHQVVIEVEARVEAENVEGMYSVNSVKRIDI